MKPETANPKLSNDLLTVPQAAKELGVCDAVVYENIKAGVIVKLPLKGRKILIPREPFERFKRGELNERGEERNATPSQRALLRGTREIIK